MAKEVTQIDLLKEISRKLDYLLTILYVQGKEKEEQVEIMTNKGYTNREIADLLGMPKGTVDWTRVQLKKKKQKKEKQKK